MRFLENLLQWFWPFWMYKLRPPDAASSRSAHHVTWCPSSISVSCEAAQDALSRWSHAWRVGLRPWTLLQCYSAATTLLLWLSARVRESCLGFTHMCNCVKIRRCVITAECDKRPSRLASCPSACLYCIWGSPSRKQIGCHSKHCGRDECRIARHTSVSYDDEERAWRHIPVKYIVFLFSCLCWKAVE